MIEINNRVVPEPQSCGVMLSYSCTAECKHCMYACSPAWSGDWMSPERLDELLGRLGKYIVPSPYGPDHISLNHGLHFSGGEPFADYELLIQGVELSQKHRIPSVFVETNCFWCRDDITTRERFLELRAAGMKGVMISVNPFYLEYVPFERTERAIRIACEIFGDDLFVYQTEYYKRFLELGIKGKLTYPDYLKIEREEDFMRNVEFFLTGRPVYALSEILSNYYPRFAPAQLAGEPCVPDFIRPWHNHFDNYGNYMPGYCGGISYGNWNELEKFIGKAPEPDEKPVLSMIMNRNFTALIDLARSAGWSELAGGYFSKCHLCVDIRKHLSKSGDYVELSPAEYYTYLE